MTVVRKCGSLQWGVKSTDNVCQLVGRCDGQWGNVRRLWGCVTVVRKQF